MVWIVIQCQLETTISWPEWINMRVGIKLKAKE